MCSDFTLQGCGYNSPVVKRGVTMTFKELAMREEMSSSNLFRKETEDSLFQSIFKNQSPIMKLWFVMMALNLAFILWIL
jgi:hypothetical protein